MAFALAPAGQGHAAIASIPSPLRGSVGPCSPPHGRNELVATVAAGLWAFGCCFSRRQVLSRRSRGAVAVNAKPPSLLKTVIRPSPQNRLKGEHPKDGDLVKIHYIGRYEDGRVFDSSRYRNQPYSFMVGQFEVIDGWESLITTMEVGERAELRCPPAYAYGQEGVDPVIPPNSTLIFDVELLEIGRPKDGDKDGVVDVSVQAEEEEEEASKFDPLRWDDKEEEKKAGASKGYSWEELGSGREVQVKVPLPADCKIGDLEIKIGTWDLRCVIKKKTIINGKLFAEADMDDSFWDTSDRKGDQVSLVITIAKLNKETMWTSLLQGEPEPEEEEAAAAEVPEVEVLNIDQALDEVNRMTRQSAATVIDAEKAS